MAVEKEYKYSVHGCNGGQQYLGLVSVEKIIKKILSA
jgi:hypothetical protein